MQNSFESTLILLQKAHEVGRGRPNSGAEEGKLSARGGGRATPKSKRADAWQAQQFVYKHHTRACLQPNHKKSKKQQKAHMGQFRPIEHAPPISKLVRLPRSYGSICLCLLVVTLPHRHSMLSSQSRLSLTTTKNRHILQTTLRWVLLPPCQGHDKQATDTIIDRRHTYSLGLAPAILCPSSLTQSTHTPPSQGRYFRSRSSPCSRKKRSSGSASSVVKQEKGGKGGDETALNVAVVSSPPTTPTYTASL